MKQMIHSNKAPAPVGAYSQAIKAGNTLYVAGQIGMQAGSAELAETFAGQLKNVFENIKAIVTAAGGALEDVVKLTIYITDFKYYAELNEIMQGYFDEPFPARAVVAVAALPKGALVEIEATVYLSEN